MQNFKRAFGITLSVVVLLLVLVFAFELTNRTIAKSGFSSGEVFDFEFNNRIFSGEILGRKFFIDFSLFFGLISKSGFLMFLLPPFIRLLILLAAMLV